MTVSLPARESRDWYAWAGEVTAATNNGSSVPGGFVAGRPGVRRCQFAWGSAGVASWTGTTLDNAHQRLPIRLPVKTTRWRLGIANITPAGATTPGDINFTGIWLGEAAPNATTGAVLGAFKAAPQQITGAFVSTGGAQVHTPWVTAANQQIDPATLYLISMGWTKSGTTIFNGAGGIFYNNASADASAINPGLITASNVAFDVFMEYEFAGSNRTYIAIGDSLTEGQGAQLNVHSWHQALSMRTGSPIAMTAHYGTNTTDWLTTTQRRWTKIADGGLNLDGAIIALGTNNAALGTPTPLATYQGHILSIVNAVRSQFGVRDVYLCNIAPRSFASGSAGENARLSYNTWINGQLPAVGVTGIFDINGALEASVGALAIRADSADADTIHWTPQGNWRASAAMSPSVG